MRNNDPLASLSIAPSAAQLKYREEAPERVATFFSDVAPSAKAFAKDAGAAFGHAFVGDSYDKPFVGSTPTNNKVDTKTRIENDNSSDFSWENILSLLNSPSPSPSGSGKVQAKPITYSDWSDAARYFGMNQETAYAEHMANTAHQREVADLRAAGLNPVLGLGSGASGVTGHVASSGGASSARKSSGESTLVDTIGATVGFLLSLTKGATTAKYASKAAAGLGKLLFKNN